MSESVLVSNLSKSYLDVDALRGVSFSVRPGESVGLLGSNGAGKSTLLHILMGFLSPDEGSAVILGTPTEKMNGRTKERIAFVAEESGLPPWATPAEVARLFRSLYGRFDGARFDRLVDEWEIPAEQRSITLSKGERRLAELALALAIRPELLLLDEPFHGLDAVMRIVVRDEIGRTLEADGVSLLYSTHILADVEKTARRVVILRAGRLALDRPVGALGAPVEEVFVDLYGLAGEAEEGEADEGENR